MPPGADVACDLAFLIAAPPASIVASARVPIEARGGVFTGDDRAGVFVVPLAVGTLKGRYDATEGVLRLRVTDKPLWVTCGAIHAALTKLLTAH